ncbi:MAG: GNAT family N-acetyltransferase [Candidatus Pacebacteria bacterium]|nr:GNAT family N-acetyltransferase [Candidatus Paceibacterota bacterium]
MKMVSFSSRAGMESFRECADVYCKIFAEPPWNENWAASKVLQDMMDQAAMPGFCGLFAREEDKIIGFTWGYLVSKIEMQEIAGNTELDFIFDGCKQVFYGDELGVSAPFRGKEYGRQLCQGLIDQVKKDNRTSAFVLRTDTMAQTARSLYHHLGFIDLHIRDNVYENRTYWRLLL